MESEAPYQPNSVDKEQLLDDNDVIRIVEEICSVQTQSITLGYLLKIPGPVLDSIHQDYTRSQDRLIRVIREFVNRIEPRPTWRVIVEALKSPLIRKQRLAKKIANKYCSVSKKSGKCS